MATRPPDKKETLLAYLARGIAMLHLDARRPGVIVPAQYAADAHLRLNLSYRYGIPDLDISDQRVQATLSFGGRPFRCILPWTSIFGITANGTGDGQVWPEDLPVEVHTMAHRFATQRRTETSPATAQAPGARRPSLSSIDGGLKEGGAAQPDPATPPEGPKQPRLRLVR
jgi:stringent starvation protein B